MERTKRILVLGESKVGKTWLLAQLFRDISSIKRSSEQLQFQLLDQSAGGSSQNLDQIPSNAESMNEADKALKSQAGCQVHVHLLNQFYTLEPSNSTFFFLEMHELSGSIGLNQTLLQVYTHQKNFDGLMVCFDMGNLTSLTRLEKLIKDGLQAVEYSRINTYGHHREFAFSSSDQEGSDLSRRLQACPFVVVGCKSDTIDKPTTLLLGNSANPANQQASSGVNRLKRITVNAQVLNELKKIDEGSQIDYLEAGLSAHRGVYKVPQDDLQLYLCKLFEDALPLVDESEEINQRHYLKRAQSTSSVSESEDDGSSNTLSHGFYGQARSRITQQSSQSQSVGSPGLSQETSQSNESATQELTKESSGLGSFFSSMIWGVSKDSQTGTQQSHTRRSGQAASTDSEQFV